MKMTEVNVADYLKSNDLLESRVLSIRYREELSELTFVIAYADIREILAQMNAGVRPLRKPEGRQYDRDFRRLTFRGVSDACRVDARYRRGFKGFDPDSLDLPPHSDFSEVVQGFAIKPDGPAYVGEVALGSMGVYRFRFRSLSEDRLLAYAVQNGPGSWSYFELDTDKELDPLDPFPGG